MTRMDPLPDSGISGPALQRLLLDAETALQLQPFSVVNKPLVPPSGDRHDYYSWSSYFWPNPDSADGMPYVHRDGETNPDTDVKSDKPRLRRMVGAVDTLALAYEHTRKPEYADKAVSFLQIWFVDPETRMNPHLQFAQCIPGEANGQPYGVIDSRWFILLLEAVSRLEAMEALPQDLGAQLRDWFGHYLDWLHTSPTGLELGKYDNNIGSWYMAQKAAYALFTGQKTLAREILTESRRFVDRQIDAEGKITHELSRTKSFDYSLYAIGALLTLAQLETNLDDARADERLMDSEAILKSIHYLARFYETGEAWPHPQIAEPAIALTYEEGVSFSVYYPYDLLHILCLAHRLFGDGDLLDVMERIPRTKREIHRANFR
jgi:hypothetical protein